MASKKTQPKGAAKATPAAAAKSKLTQQAAPKTSAPKTSAPKTSAPKTPAPKMSAPDKAARAEAGAEKSEASNRIAEGSRAPEFSLLDESGAIVNSASLSGKPYVLYFYPKDDTPGCTTEACDFRDNLRSFNDKKLRVIGVSADDPARHAKFKQKYGLNFTLLSDVDKTLANAYGVWVEKQNYGRTYLGIERSTFLIDKSGKIAKVWHRVRVPGHVAAVLESF